MESARGPEQVPLSTGYCSPSNVRPHPYQDRGHRPQRVTAGRISSSCMPYLAHPNCQTAKFCCAPSADWPRSRRDPCAVRLVNFSDHYYGTNSSCIMASCGAGL